jgi:hypothetical protein
MFSQIDASPDPIGTARKFAANTGDVNVKQMLLDRGAIEARRRRALAPAGGSTDAPPFPGG